MEILQPKHRILLQAGLVVGSGGFIFGYNVGIISGVMFRLQDVFDLSSVQEGLVVSLLSIGSLCGCFVGGYLSDKIGRWRYFFLFILRTDHWYCCYISEPFRSKMQFLFVVP